MFREPDILARAVPTYAFGLFDPWGLNGRHQTEKGRHIPVGKFDEMTEGRPRSSNFDGRARSWTRRSNSAKSSPSGDSG